MSSNSFTKENLDTYLKELAKEFRRLNGKSMPAEIVLVDGDNGAQSYFEHRNSLCHGWSAGVSAFLAEYVLGIKVLEPGCKTVSIRPDLGDLVGLSGTYPPPYGVMRIEAKRVDGKVVATVQSTQGNNDRFIKPEVLQ